MRRFLQLFFASSVLLGATGIAHADDLKWSGQTWAIRDDPSPGGPGPNVFLGRNVNVDADGALHLRIAKDKIGWSCAELNTTQPLGFGTYEMSVKTSVEGLDQNIVLGLFNYPEPTIGPDGTHEIDIEFARWGEKKNLPGNFTVWPVHQAAKNVTHPFDFKLPRAESINRFVWSKGSVAFEMLQLEKDKEIVIERWKTPANRAAEVSDKPMPLHLNLWLFEGRPLSDAKPVEIVLTSFKFTPEKPAGK